MDIFALSDLSGFPLLLLVTSSDAVNCCNGKLLHQMQLMFLGFTWIHNISALVLPPPNNSAREREREP